MFKKSGFGRRHNNNKQPKKESGSKSHHIRAWVVLNKKKNKEYERAPSMIASSTAGEGVMMSGDSPPPLQTSIPPGFDMPDEMRHGKITPTSTPLVSLKPQKSNGEVSNEDIEEAVPIIKTLPMPEPQPKIERNGFDYDHTDGKHLVNDAEEDACFVKCVYFTQQCCECMIL